VDAPLHKLCGKRHYSTQPCSLQRGDVTANAKDTLGVALKRAIEEERAGQITCPRCDGEGYVNPPKTTAERAKTWREREKDRRKAT